MSIWWTLLIASLSTGVGLILGGLLAAGKIEDLQGMLLQKQQELYRAREDKKALEETLFTERRSKAQISGSNRRLWDARHADLRRTS
jgi:hypothetical protein